MINFGTCSALEKIEMTSSFLFFLWMGVISFSGIILWWSLMSLNVTNAFFSMTMQLQRLWSMMNPFSMCKRYQQRPWQNHWHMAFQTFFSFKQNPFHSRKIPWWGITITKAMVFIHPWLFAVRWRFIKIFVQWNWKSEFLPLPYFDWDLKMHPRIHSENSLLCFWNLDITYFIK